MKQTGVYIITNTVNKKVYIGSSSYSILNRLIVHRRLLSQNKHENSYLQLSYLKYSKEAFTFEVLEFCDKNLCIQREQFWMDFYMSYNRNFGYNILEIAGSNRNFRFSEESKLKMSKAKLGKKQSKEHILNSKIARTGIKRSEKTILLQNVKKVKKVHQYSIHGDFLKTWDSLKEAETFFNAKGAIGNCIRRGFLYNSCGFKWSYNQTTLKEIREKLVKELA